MNKSAFYKHVVLIVNDYRAWSNTMCETLNSLKMALLSFDNAKLNKVLDEKLVINQQLLLINASLEQCMTERYGEFSESSAHAIMAEFPDITNNWKSLQANMRAMRRHIAEIRRVIAAIEKYHCDMDVSIHSVKPKCYKRHAYIK